MSPNWEPCEELLNIDIYLITKKIRSEDRGPSRSYLWVAEACGK